MGFKRSWVQIPPARWLLCGRTHLRGVRLVHFTRRTARRSRPYLFIMLSAGIVGLPNVGKSTLFNALTQTHKAPAENYPFCTIDPNLGIVTVPDARLAKIVEISHSQKIT